MLRRHGARAVHLASALAVADPDLIVAVWDRRLHAGLSRPGSALPQPSSVRWTGLKGFTRPPSPASLTK
jgi:hypothetical protein